MKSRITHSTRIIKGNIVLPSSKSISNRLLIIKTVGRLTTELHNLSSAKDTLTMQQCVSNLYQLNTFDIGHAGTVMRFLTAVFANTNGERMITGSDRMKQRPIAELVNCLRQLGADITYVEKEGYPPLSIKGKQLEGGKIRMNGSISSQYISALLMIAPCLASPLEIEFEGDLVSKPYIDMTIQLMKEFGAEVYWKESCIYCSNKPYSNNVGFYEVESDWSSASYMYSMAALTKEAEITVSGLHQKSLQADSECMKLFAELGVTSHFKSNGDLVITKNKLLADKLQIDFTACPDIAQTLAVVIAAKGIKAELSGLKTLKIKETDRITALQNELAKIGVLIHTTDESISIDASSIHSSDNAIHTYHDHRMALAFAPLALVLDHIEIEDPQVIEKSYPEYWEHMKQLGFTVEVVSA
ncbi:MAG TPA: 3-phosphoshikimate 1-carboxyvinyltransferase [Bacteroidia bacterium]